MVITVPASFDPAARELTVEAARAVGLGHAILLEEPQAAFYSWIEKTTKLAQTSPRRGHYPGD